MAGGAEALQTTLWETIRQIAALDDSAEALGLLQRAANVIDHELRELGSALQGSTRWSDDGFSSPAAWYAHHSGRSWQSARSLLSDATALGQMPSSRAASAAGVLNDQHIDVLTKCRSAAGDRYTDEVDATLASIQDVYELRRAGREWLQSLDRPDRITGRHEPEKAWVQLSQQLDGFWKLEGRLCEQDGLLLYQATEQLIGQALQAKADGDVSWTRMTVPAMRAQALVELVDAFWRAVPSDATRNNRYRVNLTLRLDAHGLEATQPLPVEAMCDSEFVRMVLGADGELLDVGRAVRPFPGAMAAAIRARDGTCTFPGCQRPAHMTDVHHGVPWADGGTTTVDNGQAICRWHHVFIHRRGWTARLDEHQHPVFLLPDGTRYHAPPSQRPRRE